MNVARGFRPVKKEPSGDCNRVRQDGLAVGGTTYKKTNEKRIYKILTKQIFQMP